MGQSVKLFSLLVVFLVIACQLSCKSGEKFSFRKKLQIPYTESELNLILAIEFLKTNVKRCAPDCVIKVESTFEFFDTCHLSEPMIDRNKTIKKSIKLPEGSYLVEGLGRVDFYSYLPDETPDWRFSPLYEGLSNPNYLAFFALHKNYTGFYGHFDIRFNKIKPNEVFFNYYLGDCTPIFDVERL
jgi:hypothetical protein